MIVEVLVTNGAVRGVLKSFFLSFEIFPVTKITFYESISFKTLLLNNSIARSQHSITIDDERRVWNTLCHIFPETFAWNLHRSRIRTVRGNYQIKNLSDFPSPDVLGKSHLQQILLY